jgi:hypothetical protein
MYEKKAQPLHLHGDIYLKRALTLVCGWLHMTQAHKAKLPGRSPSDNGQTAAAIVRARLKVCAHAVSWAFSIQPLLYRPEF